MRLFVAIQLDPLVIDRLASCSHELKTRTKVRAPAARVTWVPADRFHVTVHFIGDVDDRTGSAVVAALGPPIDQEPFVMQVRGVGRFPPRGTPRVLWAGIGSAVEPFAQLGGGVAGRLAACHAPMAEAPGRPHVTLARVRAARGLHAAGLFDGFEEHDFGTASVEAITLFQSRQSSGGVEYVALQHTMLRRR